MKKTLLLFLIILSGFTLKAQTQTLITFTANVDPIYSNDASVLITAQGETNNFAVDMGTIPSVAGVVATVSPSNGTAYLSDITRVSYYSSAAGTKSSFTAKVYSSVNFDVTASWNVNVNFVNINGNSVSTGTVKFTATIKPGTRPPAVYYSAAYSKSFTRNNCGAGYQGTTVSYGLAAGAKTSTVSQTAANQLAIDYVNTNGQAYANTNGGCNIVYNSAAISGNFTRNNCASQYESVTPVSYTLPAGAKTSIVSQADADAQALVLFNTNGQANANSTGTCVIKNKTFITYVNNGRNGAKVTRLQVFNGATQVYDFTEAQLIAGAEIDHGTYNFVFTTIGDPPTTHNRTDPTFGVIEVHSVEANTDYSVLSVAGITSYTIANVNTVTTTNLKITVQPFPPVID